MIPLPQSTSAALLHSLIGNEPNDNGSDGSIFQKLKSFLDREGVSLDPSPVLNSILGRLVALLQGVSHSPSDEVEGRLFSEIQKDVCQIIDNNEVLRKRAEFIRDLAMNAEFHLEMYHVKSMLLKKNLYPALDPIDKLRIASDSFPYVDHYIDMVKKESEIIQKVLISSDRNGFGRPMSINDDFKRDDWKRVVVFCGSGPLPFTGILMAMILKVRVVLIDCDADAVDLSQKLILHWEKEEVIPVGVVTVMHAKGEDCSFYNPDATLKHRPTENMVPCHVVFIAGLISNDIKEHMIRKISELEHAGPLVVMRTAHGLTARFAYYQTRRKTITKHLGLIGIVAPETHRDRNGLVIDDHVRPIDFFSANILNSLELYSWHQSTSSTFT